MDNVTFNDVEFMGVITTYALITHSDGSTTSMTKATYEAQQAVQEHSTES
jgi:hypothetical protein